ncbi:MAG: gamma-glutamyl-gamma-aminobutyrate hydrolase family protein, partial [Bacteroidota bacterium]
MASKKMLRIGVSPGFIYPDPNRDTYSGKTLNYLETDTARYLLEHGALPILIPKTTQETYKRIFPELHGLILQG